MTITIQDLAKQMQRIEDKLDQFIASRRGCLSNAAMLVLDTLRANGQLTTSDLAEMLGKNYTTTSQILNRLAKAGMVKKERLAESGPGRKRELYEAIA